MFDKEQWSINAIRRQIRPLDVAAFGIFCVCLPIAIWNGLVHLDPVLKILMIVVSWPAAICVLGLVFFRRFQGSIDVFLRNVRSVQFPGGNVQMQSPDNSGPANAGQIVLTNEQRDQLVTYMSDLQQQHAAASTSVEELHKQIVIISEQKVVYEFHYLNLFFVFRTKQVLLWFTQQGTQTRQTFDQTWQAAISDVNQRTVILDVLLEHRMLEPDGNLIKPTCKGYGFLQFIGLIPYAPQSSQATLG